MCYVYVDAHDQNTCTITVFWCHIPVIKIDLHCMFILLNHVIGNIQLCNGATNEKGLYCFFVHLIKTNVYCDFYVVDVLHVHFCAIKDLL